MAIYDSYFCFLCFRFGNICHFFFDFIPISWPPVVFLVPSNCVNIQHCWCPWFPSFCIDIICVSSRLQARRSLYHGRMPTPPRQDSPTLSYLPPPHTIWWGETPSPAWERFNIKLLAAIPPSHSSPALNQERGPSFGSTLTVMIYCCDACIPVCL